MRPRVWPGVIAVVVLVAVAALIQRSIDLEKKTEGGYALYEYRFIGPTILGFKDVVADLLWVHANMLFWDKQFFRVIPLFSIITFIDPHYTQVYMVGAWHFAWNIPPLIKCGEEETQMWVRNGVAFLREGIKSNPESWRMHFELGWLYFQKWQRYDLAGQEFAISRTLPESPIYVEHMLGHAFERNGELAGALEVWKNCLKAHPDDRVAARIIQEVSEKLDRKKKGLEVEETPEVVDDSSEGLLHEGH